MKLVVDYLKSASRKTPANPAVIGGETCLCYAELDALSDQIAAGLQAVGISPGERVGIYLPKSVEAVASIYAALKLGCCYVPIALENPLPRISYILENCAIRLVLAATALESEVEHELRKLGVQVIAVQNLAAASGQNVFTASNPAPQDTAAILHTSGSTGQPKGAVITHENLAVFLSWALSAFELRSSDRLLSHAPLHFDLSFFDIFAAAAAAAAVVLATPSDTANAARMARLVTQSGVTVWQSVPSALTLQVVSSRQLPDAMPSVRCVLFAGERMPRQTLLALPDGFPNARFYNVYGCTETNDTFMYPLPHEVTQAPDPLPIGKPLPYIRYRIVDESGNDVGNGQEGQLLVAGGTVMTGYLSPADSALRLADGGAGDGFYRTKDIVSVGEDGHLRFHGRTDAIVKTNGYRVNLLEIEDHLRRSERLAEVALLCVPDDLIGNRIIAIVRPRAGESCSTLDLKLHCAAALPKYAIPRCFRITHEELPKGSTGKVDKRLLTQIWRQSAYQSTNKGSAYHELA